MTTLPLGTVLVAQQLVQRELGSALPHAPVVAHHERPARPALRRTRTVTATALHRAAARISPA